MSSSALIEGNNLGGAHCGLDAALKCSMIELFSIPIFCGHKAGQANEDQFDLFHGRNGTDGHFEIRAFGVLRTAEQQDDLCIGGPEAKSQRARIMPASQGCLMRCGVRRTSKA